MLRIARTVARGHGRVSEKSDSHGRAAVDNQCHEYDVGVELELGVLIAGS